MYKTKIYMLKDMSIKTFDSVSELSKVSKPDQRNRAASMVSTISGYLLEDDNNDKKNCYLKCKIKNPI